MFLRSRGLAGIIHRFSLRRGESAGLARRVTGGPRKRTVGYVEEGYRAERRQGGCFRRCSRESMNNPGLGSFFSGQALSQCQDVFD